MMSRATSQKIQIYGGIILVLISLLVTALMTNKNLIKVEKEYEGWYTSNQSSLHAIDQIIQNINKITLNASGFVSGDSTNLNQIEQHVLQIEDRLEELQSGLNAIYKLSGHQIKDNYLSDSLRYLHTILPQLEQLDLNNRSQTVQFLNRVRDFNNQQIENILLLKEEILNHRVSTYEERNDTLKKARTLNFLSFGIALIILITVSYVVMRIFTAFQKNEKTIRETNIHFAKVSKENESKNWLLDGLAQLDDSIRGGLGVKDIADNSLQYLANYLDAQAATMYVKKEDSEEFQLISTYAIPQLQQLPQTITPGEGLAGQALRDNTRKVLQHVPNAYLRVQSSLFEGQATQIVIQPLTFEGEHFGLLELAFLKGEKPVHKEFLQRAALAIAVSLKVSQTHAKLTDLYYEIQQQTEELEAQQEELRTTNEELIHKTHLLEISEEELRVQQEELQEANAELEEKTKLLEQQNISIEEARDSIMRKASQLAEASRYKSEFLANMSHELRTPLNSILILAKILEENKHGNLVEEQVKYARVIHSAGNDLLNLINDVLDLAKIESGKVEVLYDDVWVSLISERMLQLFGTLAEQKGIEFKIEVGAKAPSQFVSDEHRLEQILKNLLSNAFKFTADKGQVLLKVDQGPSDFSYRSAHLKALPAEEILRLDVIDTGVGIALEKQEIIFEAFNQEDGSTSRKYGGTGLGLSICKELAQLLGGEIHLKSKPGEGSTFTLFLPVHPKEKSNHIAKSTMELLDKLPQPVQIKPQEKKNIPIGPTKAENKRTLLIIEDDQTFAEILQDYVKENGFDTLWAPAGEEGLHMAEQAQPDAIILDVMLPGMDGWAVLKALKANIKTQHIPVHMMSASDDFSPLTSEKGAIGFLKKPVNKDSINEALQVIHQQLHTDRQKILLIEDHEIQSDFLRDHLVEGGKIVIQAFTADDALRILQDDQQIDCIILDLHLPDKCGMNLLEEIKKIAGHEDTPIVVNTAMALNDQETREIMRFSNATVIKSEKSTNRLLDEVNLFINRVKNQDQDFTQNSLMAAPSQQNAFTTQDGFNQKQILLVDDDMRNIFALSTVLQEHDLHVLIANNGEEALEQLDQHPQIELILMDIMMPGMDGNETIREIRKNKKFTQLPIIAVTAKAMKDDIQKSSEAGANDYVTKPIDIDQLLNLIRVWLS
jgi:CheY-like chemotaxis protein/signal transduction histidine kinase